MVSVKIVPTTADPPKIRKHASLMSASKLKSSHSMELVSLVLIIKSQHRSLAKMARKAQCAIGLSANRMKSSFLIDHVKNVKITKDLQVIELHASPTSASLNNTWVLTVSANPAPNSASKHRVGFNATTHVAVRSK